MKSLSGRPRGLSAHFLGRRYGARSAVYQVNPFTAEYLDTVTGFSGTPKHKCQVRSSVVTCSSLPENRVRLQNCGRGTHVMYGLNRWSRVEVGSPAPAGLFLGGVPRSDKSPLG